MSDQKESDDVTFKLKKSRSNSLTKSSSIETSTKRRSDSLTRVKSTDKVFIEDGMMLNLRKSASIEKK